MSTSNASNDSEALRKGDSSDMKTMTLSEDSQAQPQAPKHVAPHALQGPFDSGLVVWLQVLGSFCLWTNSWGLYNAYGEFQTFYQQYYLPNHSADAIAWIGSLQAFLLLSVGAVSGLLYDAGYHNVLLIGGNLLVVFGMMMTSLCDQYWQLVLAQGIVVGTGFGFLFTPSVVIIPQWFQKHRALATGLAASGSGIGGVVYAIIFREISQSIGFPWATRVIGFVALFLAVIAIAVLRSKIPKAPSMRNLFELESIRNVPFVIFVAGCFFAFMTVYDPYFYIQPYALSKLHDSSYIVSYLVVFINTGSAVGRMAIGLTANYFGALNIYIFCAAMSTILIFCWIRITSVGGLIAFAVIYGIFSGGLLGFASLAALPLIPDLRKLGTWLGQGQFMFSFGVLIGTPIVGALTKNANGYLHLQIFAGVLFGVGVILIGISRGLKTSWQIMKKI